MPRNVLMVALILPLIVIAIGIGRAEHHLATSRVWTFDINGYDPRDLLRGHYIQFVVELNEGPPIEACDDDTSARCCFCLTTTAPDQPPQVAAASCQYAQAQCDGALQMRHLKQLSRYYIPEAEAWKLEQQVQEAARQNTAQLRVAINDDGEPQIKALLVNGQEILARDP